MESYPVFCIVAELRWQRMDGVAGLEVDRVVEWKALKLVAECVIE